MRSDFIVKLYILLHAFAGIEIEDDTEIYPIAVDFEVGNIADPDLIWMFGGKYGYRKCLGQRQALNTVRKRCMRIPPSGTSSQVF